MKSQNNLYMYVYTYNMKIKSNLYSQFITINYDDGLEIRLN